MAPAMGPGVSRAPSTIATYVPLGLSKYSQGGVLGSLICAAWHLLLPTLCGFREQQGLPSQAGRDSRAHMAAVHRS